MIYDAPHRSRLARATFGICACLSLACGEISDTDDGVVDTGGRSGSGGAAGSSAAGSAGRGGQTSQGGTSGASAEADAGPGGSAGTSQGGSYTVPEGCPTPTAIPAPGQ